MEAQAEDVTEEGINYVAMRNLFVREAREAVDVRVEKKSRTKVVRESVERMELDRTVNSMNSTVNRHIHLIQSLMKPRKSESGFALVLHRWTSGLSSARK